jgi:hypothetical protein
VSYERLGDVSRALGDAPKAQWYFEQRLVIARRLSETAEENADYARDLSISYERMALLVEDCSDPLLARSWWLRTYDVLSEMRDRGLFLSPEDQAYLHELKETLSPK